MRSSNSALLGLLALSINSRMVDSREPVGPRPRTQVFQRLVINVPHQYLAHDSLHDIDHDIRNGLNFNRTDIGAHRAFEPVNPVRSTRRNLRQHLVTQRATQVQCIDNREPFAVGFRLHVDVQLEGLACEIGGLAAAFGRNRQ